MNKAELYLELFKCYCATDSEKAEDCILEALDEVWKEMSESETIKVERALAGIPSKRHGAKALCASENPEKSQNIKN